MKFLIFDTETTGLPKNYGAKWQVLDNWPRLTQFAFMLIDIDGNELIKKSTLIKPDGWELPKTEFFINNNMSTERCQDEGVPIFGVLREFQDALRYCDYKVAHNINFDNGIVGSEIIRAGITLELFQYRKGLCTMNKTTSWCDIKFPGSQRRKWPKLEELHQKLFNKGFEGAHDALEDVRATGRCLIECINRGIIQVKT